MTMISPSESERAAVARAREAAHELRRIRARFESERGVPPRRTIVYADWTRPDEEDGR
jgi:hypothetical protein